MICTTFDKAMTDTRGRRRNLLFGNGVSVAAHRAFAYDSLLEVAVAKDWPIGELFERLGTRNFEVAMDRVGPEDRARLQAAFISAVRVVHPSHTDLGGIKRAECAKFLARFIGRDCKLRGVLFTTNYDLMLNWVLVQHSDALDAWDGFDADSVWGPNRRSLTFVWFLHGALHLRRVPLGASHQVRILRRDERNPRGGLLDQVADHLESGQPPVFVSEGRPEEKSLRIDENSYLSGAREAFRRSCSEAGSVLFTVGHSLADVDSHLTDIIGVGNLAGVFIGVFSEEDREQAERVATRWSQLRENAKKTPLNVQLFDVRGCPVWGPAPAAHRASKQLGFRGAR